MTLTFILAGASSMNKTVGSFFKNSWTLVLGSILMLVCACMIILDKSKPDGTKRKIIDNSIALSYGWKPKINLDDGFELTLKLYFSKSNK